MSRAAFLTAVLTIAIVTVVSGGSASTAPSGGAGALNAFAGTAHPSPAITLAGPGLLERAVASINVAPSHPDSAVPCAVSSDMAATCDGSAPALLSHLGMTSGRNLATAAGESTGAFHSRGAAVSSPARALTPAVGDMAWYNVTGNLSTASGGNIPAIGYGARMAFDPRLQEVVLFSGSGYATSEPYENITWVYNGVDWTNLTGSLSLAPSPRLWPGFGYDPTLGGVVLVGGWNASDDGLNDTWLFTGSWKNITSTTGPLLDNDGDYLAEGGIGGSAAAWDPALQGFLLVDGCDDDECGEAYALTWLLNSTGWHTIDYGPGWGSETWLGYTGMAYDATDGYMVLYGGFDVESDHPQNYTYTYSGGPEFAGNWVNISASDAGCTPACATPPGRDDSSITWDAQLGGIFLTGGYNYTDTLNDGLYNDTWEFLGGLWYPLTPSAPAAFLPIEGPALSTNSTDIGVFMVGGDCYPGSCGSSEWVFETPPEATLSESPNPVDAGGVATFNAGWTTGTGTGWYAGWNLSTGDGHHTTLRAAVGLNSFTAFTKAISYTYALSGNATARVTWSDFFYISNTSAVLHLTVDPSLAATIKASSTSISAGGSVTFTTSPTGGSGTYTYAWEFGDGTTSTAAAPPAHVYAKAGNYTVNLTVTDSTGNSIKSSISIVVAAAPAFLGLGATLTYLIIGLVAVVVVIAAAVLLMRRRKKPAAPQPWQAGTAPSGAGGPPPGATSEVPPGVGGAPPPPPPPPS